jgi:hypothetical protein
MLAEQLTRIYDANVSSLDALEHLCRADERDFGGRITSLKLATNNGDKATLATYEIASDMTVGYLALAEYKSEVDEQSLRAIHTSNGDDFLFKGEAYIQNSPVKLLAFGGHGTGDRP